MQALFLAGCLSLILFAQGISANSVVSSIGPLPRHLSSHVKATQLSLDMLTRSETIVEARAKAAQLQAALSTSHDETLYNLFIAWANQMEQYYESEPEVLEAFDRFVQTVKHMVDHNLNTEFDHWRGLTKLSASSPRKMFGLSRKFGLSGKCPGKTLGGSSIPAAAPPAKAPSGHAAPSPPACSQTAGADPPKFTGSPYLTANWVVKGQTTPVKNQGGACNSAWANAAATAIDSAYSIQKGTTPFSVSRQEFISCLTSTSIKDANSHGCDYGRPEDALNFLEVASGVPETTYPYTSAGGQVAACVNAYLTANKVNSGNVSWIKETCSSANSCGTSGLQEYQKDSASFLLQAVGGAKLVTGTWPGQPVIAYWSFLNASDPQGTGPCQGYDCNFLHYSGGIYGAAIKGMGTGYQAYVQLNQKATVCPNPAGTTDAGMLNHVMVIVGYNLTAVPPYWIVQNSWGKSWGENGFIRVAFNQGKVGVCGLTSLPVGPNMNYTSNVPVKSISTKCITAGSTLDCKISIATQCAALPLAACKANTMCNNPPYNFCPEL
jgi:hypothetical protein